MGMLVLFTEVSAMSDSLKDLNIIIIEVPFDGRKNRNLVKQMTGKGVPTKRSARVKARGKHRGSRSTKMCVGKKEEASTAERFCKPHARTYHMHRP